VSVSERWSRASTRRRHGRLRINGLRSALRGGRVGGIGHHTGIDPAVLTFIIRPVLTPAVLTLLGPAASLPSKRMRRSEPQAPEASLSGEFVYG
jgi:hypothetical protein